MSDEVSQLERQPDSLRSAVDPALEESAYPDHLDQDQHSDHNLPNGDFSDLEHGQMAEMTHQQALEGLMGTEPQEPFSPRRGHTHRRIEEPPRNTQGKFLCKFQSTCATLTFDRRCEWSKHMDKHDRPYKCREPGCEKLLGFTYSGGLLRHQREVHRMHGGTRKPLYCPEPNCKRNQGAGFTRKENLSEHIRRVHQRSTTDSDMAAQAQDGLDQLEAAAAAAQAVEESEHTDGERSAKRKRFDPQLTSEVVNYEFNLESDSVKRLKSENADLKDRMKQMEEEMVAQRALLQELVNRQTGPAPTASMMVS